MGVSLFIGSLISAYCTGKIGIYRTVTLGFYITLLGGMLMALWYIIAGLSIDGFIWPMLPIGIGGTFCLGAGTGGSMEPFGDTAGAASALGGALRFFFSGVIGLIVIDKHMTSTLPLAMPAIILSLLGLILFISQRRLLEISKP